MWAWLAILLALALPAFAAGPAKDAGARTENRFPQPVRAGDLIGRKLIGPQESQPLLGHVDGVTKQADGAIDLRVRTSTLLPWGGRTVEVPVNVVALLGEHVALMDLTPAQLAALPDASQSSLPVAPNDNVKIGVVRPFH